MPRRARKRRKDDQPREPSGIVEADEMFILESQKGSRKLTGQLGDVVAKLAGAVFQGNSTAFSRRATVAGRLSMP